jgi:predicted PolB exonuclease-like 3'-5' exonuclease
VLGDLYGSYTQINKISDNDKEWLKSVGIDIDNKDPDLVASGIYDDWPVGRGVFIEDDKKFVVLVNFEDHLKFISLSTKTDRSDDINKGF